MLGRALQIGALGAFIVSAGCGSSDLIGLHPEIAQASRELDAAYAEAQRLGLPLTADELEGPPIPDAENGAVGMRELLTDWQEGRPEAKGGNGLVSADAIPPSQPRPAVIAAYDDRFFAKLQPLLARPKFQIRRGYAEPLGVMFPEFAQMKAAGKALAWRAQERARSGSVEGAISDLKDVRRLGWASGQDPVLIGGLVAIALDSIAIRSAQLAAESWKDRPEALGALQAALAESLPPLSLRHALRGEVFMGVSVTRNLEAYGGVQGFMAAAGMVQGPEMPVKTIDVQTLRIDGMPQEAGSRAFMARHLQAWNLAFAAEDLSEVELSRMLDRMAADIERQKKPSMLLSQVLFPVFSQAGMAYAKRLGKHELALAGLTVMAHRARTGALPKTLAEAGAAERISFLDQLIRYEARGGRFCLWTAGPDGRDGGPQFDAVTSRAFSEDGREPNDDFALTWPPVEANR
jgi:hypothetical protein